jgi:predicted nuclease with TOPRIM domain
MLKDLIAVAGIAKHFLSICQTLQSENQALQTETDEATAKLGKAKKRVSQLETDLERKTGKIDFLEGELYTLEG